MTTIARLIGWTGLTAAGALHVVWATGSTWPAKNAKRLSEAVVGTRAAMPPAGATAVVATAAFVGAAVTAGVLGEGRTAVLLRRAMGAGMLARAVLGGAAALTALRLPPPGERFRELDRRCYRPLFALLGVAILIGARRDRHPAS